jgi:hypothetical protein
MYIGNSLEFPDKHKIDIPERFYGDNRSVVHTATIMEGCEMDTEGQNPYLPSWQGMNLSFQLRDRCPSGFLSSLQIWKVRF